MKKRIMALFLSVSMLALSACSSQEAAPAGSLSESEAGSEVEWSLVVYTTHSDKELNIIQEAFAEAHPEIKLEFIAGGTGELLARIQAEAENPQADVMFGGLSQADGDTYADLYEVYVSPHDAEMYDNCKNTYGFYSYFSTQITNLIINEQLCADLGVEVSSYDDLLRPELKGKIITADPTTSSSAWHFLTATLLAKGGYDSQEAWDFVAKLIDNLDGVVASGSSGPYKSVIDGEYAVGLTFEDASVQQIIDGAEGVKIVYPEEGTTGVAYGGAIIKNCVHPEAAKAFMDFMLSSEGQRVRAEKMGCVRGTNKDNDYVSSYMPATEDLVMLTEDFDYLSEHKQEMSDKWIDLWTAANG